MQPFNINRNSWHYKLNKHFFNEYNWGMEKYWEPRHNSFCSYWRATMFRLVFASFIICLITFLVTILSVGIYNDPIGFLFFFLSIALFIGVIIAGTAITFYIKDRNEKNADKQQSLFMQKYRAYKSKICPSVDYKN